MNSTFNLTSINYYGNSKYQTTTSSLSHPPHYQNASLKKHKQNNTTQSSSNFNSFSPSPHSNQESIFTKIIKNYPIKYNNTTSTISSKQNPKHKPRHIRTQSHQITKVNHNNFNKTSSYFLINNQKKFEQTKKNFIYYLLDDNLQFAELPKIENELTKLGTEYQNKINKNNNIISKKERELKELNENMQRNILEHYNYKNKELLNYEKQYIQLNNQIDSLKYDLGIYKEEKFRLLNERAVLDKKVKEAAKELSQTQTAHEQYKIIAETIKSETKTRNTLLNQMKIFEFQSGQLMDKKLRNKKAKYVNTEYELQEIKQNVEELDKKLNKLHKKKQKKLSKIKEDSERNEKIIYDLSNIRRDYLSNKLKLMLIYSQFKMKKIETLLDKYQNDNIKYNTSNSIYHFELKNLTELHSTLTEEQKRYDDVYNQMLNETKKSKRNKRIKNYNENITLINKEYGDLFKKIQKMKFENELKRKRYYELIIILKLVYNYIEHYDEEFNNIISLIIFDIIHNTTNQFLTLNFSINKVNIYIQNNGLSNKDYNLKYININNKQKLELSDFKTLLKIFLKYQRKILFLYNSLTFSLFNEHHSTNTIKKGEVVSLQNLFSNEYTFDESKQNRLKVYEQKLAIKYLTSSNVFSKRLSTNSEQSVDNVQNQIKLSTVISQYSQKKNDNNIITLFHSKACKFFLPFTNNLVYNDHNTTKNKKHHLSTHKSLSKHKPSKTVIDASSSHKVISPELIIEKSKLKTRDEYNYIYKENDNSDEDSEVIINPYNNGDYDARNRNKKKLNHTLTGWDSMNKYQKMNDLYKLSYNLFSYKGSNKVFDKVYTDFSIKKNSKMYKEIKEKQKKKYEEIKINKNNQMKNKNKTKDSLWCSAKNVKSTIDKEEIIEEFDRRKKSEDFSLMKSRQHNIAQNLSNLKSLIKMQTMSTFYTKPNEHVISLSKGDDDNGKGKSKKRKNFLTIKTEEKDAF